VTFLLFTKTRLQNNENHIMHDTFYSKFCAGFMNAYT